jgi:hypothetical protein
MKKVNISLCLLATVFLLFLISCSGSNTSPETPDNDTTAAVATEDVPATPAYDPAMDPLTVGAKMSKKLGDSLGVKMYEFTAKPGESWALHNHPDHLVYVLQGGKMAL